ncbi:hypothetical protein [Levilactobacillus brevis]|uniref:hypothetical protein n=1 Tax=Levilactobacillus brevis TaxID=1580 RepID=UPI001CDC23F0|nr:hypothetical protein [Levilactobacillus brevis]
MVDSSRTIMTDAGFALETRVRADETKMQFTRAAISTDDHFSDTDDALAKLTELSNIQQDGKVTAVQVINTTTVYVQVDVNQAESKADYQMRSAALYAKDDDGTEVLYGVTVLQDPVFVHKDADGSYLGFGINTTVGKASNVVVVVDPANMVTQQVFEGAMKNYYTKAEVDAKFVTDDDFASKLPQNIATTDAANTFAKSQTLAGGATDGKGNAYATTKDVATGLNNGLSTKVTDNKNGTEQLNGVQVQPFNKLSDTIGGRNLLPGTSGTLQIVTNASGWNNNLPVIHQVLTPIDSDATYTARAWISPALHDVNIQVAWKDAQGDKQDGGNVISAGTSGYSTWTGTLTAGSTIKYVTIAFRALQSTPSSVSYKEMKLEKGTVATNWTPAPEDKQDKIGYTPADDSKVAHLSGANNFDTVPTVNNNPLLLTSSLPAELARTGSDQEFTGKNTFDTAPIDKTTGNPYITKDGVPAVPSTLADTTKDANFTGKLQKSGIDVATKSDVTTAVSAVNANMVHRNPDTGVVSEPVDFTKLTVEGGKSVATRDDLKSVADKAWYKLDNKYITPASGYTLADPATNVLYKIDDSIHTLYLSGAIVLTDSNAYNVPVTVHLGSIIKSINTYLVTYLGYLRTNDYWDFASVIPIGTNLTFLPVHGIACITAPSGTAGQYDSVTYDELV